MYEYCIWGQDFTSFPNSNEGKFGAAKHHTTVPPKIFRLRTFVSVRSLVEPFLPKAGEKTYTFIAWFRDISSSYMPAFNSHAALQPTPCRRLCRRRRGRRDGLTE